MVQAKARVLGIAPYEGMKLAMERAAEAYPELRLDVHTGDLEAGADVVRKTPQGLYDCIISRGGTAQLIQQVTETPVVEIELSVYDVLRAVKLAGGYSESYAIVGFPSITGPAYTLCDLLRYEAEILTVNSADEASETLERLKQKGCRMVVGDMVAHTIARQMGMNAFLVTSGAEAFHAAFEQALAISTKSRPLRLENLFLRSVTGGENDRVIVLDEAGELFYSIPDKQPSTLLGALRAKRSEIPHGASLKFYHNEHDMLYAVTARILSMAGERYYLFRCLSAQIPLRSNKSGLRFFNKSECEHLFMNSFYSISGAMGELESILPSIAAVRQPVMILGEPGTGKEQIARFLYLRSPLCNRIFVVADCALMNDRSWEFLLNHYNSPLNDADNTVYFQNFESIPDQRRLELLSVILETGLPKRERLIFSCACPDGVSLEVARLFSTKLGCMVLRLPSLRSRTDEIPSLASLYLASLNMELGKQISGFDPRAMELLTRYEWPNNYTQFKGVLYELAALTTSSYIRSNVVAELLTRERRLNRSGPSSHDDAKEQTLDEIIKNAIWQAVSANNGNQTAAARQLKISRTTMWRYLRQRDEPSPAEKIKEQ